MFSQVKNVYSLQRNLPYPQRAIRDSSFLYIQNFEPDRWPAGSPYIKSSHGWEYGDIDLSPTFILCRIILIILMLKGF